MRSQEEAGPSGRDIGMEDVETKYLGSVDFHGNPQDEEASVGVSSASHPREGILVSNLRSKVTSDELGKIRYLYKISKCVEIRALEAHERVDWVVPSWVGLYEFVF